MESESALRPLDERIRDAGAERSVALGGAIGDALAALWRVIGTLPFSPSASSMREPSPATSLLMRFASHR